MTTSKQTVLVTASTGTQGGAAVTALLSSGFHVRALVRDPGTAPARALHEQGAEVVQGTLDDPQALAQAMDGVYGVFSVPLVGGEADPGLEMRAGRAVIAAAKEQSVEAFVHSSVARAGEHEQFVGWSEGRWWAQYWQDKADLNEAVRSSGLKHWTILKPVYIMENFLPTKASFMMPTLVEGKLMTAAQPGTRLDLIAAENIGAFAAAAFANPARFASQEIPLASDSLTMGEMAAILSGVTGKRVESVHLPAEEVMAAGLPKVVVDSQEWDSVEGYQVDIPQAKSWDIALTPFQDWAAANRSGFDIR